MPSFDPWGPYRDLEAAIQRFTNIFDRMPRLVADSNPATWFSYTPCKVCGRHRGTDPILDLDERCVACRYGLESPA